MDSDGLTQLCAVLHPGKFVTGGKFEVAYKSEKLISKPIFFSFHVVM